jgi:hypothetical protein
MEQVIGPNHGITAAVNRLRDKDPSGTSLKKVNGKWQSITTLTNPVSEWKAYDKFERALLILVSDHDGDISPLPSRPRTLFDVLYAYVRGPYSGSETEKCQSLKAAGYKTIAFNVGDYSPSQWSESWLGKADQNSLTSIPWARCHTVAHVSALKAIANQWSSPGLIVNLEQEDGSPRWIMSGEDCANALRDYKGQIGISTECWMPDNFNWQPLIEMGAVALPQTSMAEFPWCPPKVAVDRAKQFGWIKPKPSLATYNVGVTDQQRADYVWFETFGIYTVDDLQPNEILLWV